MGVLPLSAYLRSDAIFFLEEAPKFELLKTLCQKLKASGVIEDQAAFEKAVFERENFVSTGVGMGIALPHAKLDALDDFFIACGILTVGTCDWDSIDQLPVKVIFLIGGPSHQQLKYLKLLSELTQKIKQKSVRQALFKAKTKAEVLEALA